MPEINDLPAEQITIPADLNGLLQAAEAILPPKSADVVLEKIKDRAKWETIKNRFQELTQTMSGAKAIYELADEFHYSPKTIEAILYTR